MPNINPIGTNKANGIVYPQAPFTKQYSMYSLKIIILMTNTD